MKTWSKLGCGLISLALMMGGLTASAFAYGAEPESEPEQEPEPMFEETEEPVTILEEESGPLTPEGNLTLVDDYYTTFSDGSGQQFITLVSKSGAYFYLVIDRDSEGKQTVHFMNLVDEADLLTLMEEDQAEAYNAEKEAALQAEREKQQAEEEARKAAEEEARAAAESEDKDLDLTDLASKFLAVVLLIGLAAGGGFYFFIQKKRKEQAEKESADPDADYREGEEELELPLEEGSPDDEAKRKAYQTHDAYEEE